MIHMTLYWGRELTLLFDSWTTESWPSYALVLLLCFLFAVLSQRLEAIRLRLKFPSPASSNFLEPPVVVGKRGRTWRVRVAESVLFGVNSAIGYLIMLAIMSYNGGVFVAVVLGLMVGYYVFRGGYLVAGDEDLGVDVDAGGDTCACS